MVPIEGGAWNVSADYAGQTRATHQSLNSRWVLCAIDRLSQQRGQSARHPSRPTISAALPLRTPCRWACGESTGSRRRQTRTASWSECACWHIGC